MYSTRQGIATGKHKTKVIQKDSRIFRHIQA